MKHGELVKKLREERNLTQGYLSEGILPRSTLATFENTDSKLNFNTLIQLLHRMNVTLDEYEYLYNDQTPNEKNEFSNRVLQKFHSQFDPELEQALLDRYTETQDFMFYSLYAQYNLVRWLYGDMTDQKKINTITTSIKAYLDRIDVWGRFELVLFINCLHIFEERYIIFQFRGAIKKMKLYTQNPNYSKDLYSFVINGLNLSFEKGYWELFELLMNELDDMVAAYDEENAKLFQKTFRLLFNARQGQSNETEKNFLIEIFRYLNEPEWAEYIEKNYGDNEIR